MIVFWGTYIVIAFLWFSFCAGAATEEYGDERRKAARWAFAAPLWPLLVLWKAGEGLLWLAREAVRK